MAAVVVTQVRLIFCEGPHDVAFMRLVLSELHEFESRKLKFSELPYPFADLFKKSVESSAAEDLRLDMARKFFLPDHLLQRDHTLVMLFNYGGSNRKTSVLPFLDKLVFLLRNGSAFGVAPMVRYLFMADADTLGVTEVCGQIALEFGLVADQAWLSDAWLALPHTRGFQHGSPSADVATYVWQKWGQNTGTLEDMVYECWTAHDALKAALVFLDQQFAWDIGPTAAPERVCSEHAKRLKAGFCVAGQRAKPGASLNVILDQGKLISKNALAGSRSVADLSQFLTQWLPATVISNQGAERL